MIDPATGVATVDTVVIWCGALVAIVGAAAALWRIGRVVRRIAHRIDEFTEDWLGTEDRPGVPGRDGVMTRLGGIEKRLTAVEHELRPNSGSSMRDAIDRVERHTLRLTPETELPQEATHAARNP